MIAIYKITAPYGKVYIGQSRWFHKRLRSYKSGHLKSQRKLYYSFQKYGFDAHLIEIVHELPNDVTQEIIDSYEQLYMDLYEGCGIPLLNIKQAGSKGKASEETKALMSLSNKGKYYRKDWKPSNEHIEKLRIANTGKSRPIEVTEKIRKALKGKKISDDHKAILLQHVGNRKGAVFTEDHKRKLSEASKGRAKSQDHRKAISVTLKGNIPWNKGLKGKYTIDKNRREVTWL